MWVVWERVIATDWSAPGTGVLALIPDPRAAQYWDAERVLSKRMGERPGERDSIVWDWVAVYAPGARWEDAPPKPVYSGRPVVDVEAELRNALRTALQ